MLKFKNLVVLSLVFVLSFAYSMRQDKSIDSAQQAQLDEQAVVHQFSNIVQDVGFKSFTESSQDHLSLKSVSKQPSIMSGKLKHTMDSPEKQL